MTLGVDQGVLSSGHVEDSNLVFSAPSINERETGIFLISSKAHRERNEDRALLISCLASPKKLHFLPAKKIVVQIILLSVSEDWGRKENRKDQGKCKFP